MNLPGLVDEDEVIDVSGFGDFDVRVVESGYPVVRRTMHEGRRFVDLEDLIAAIRVQGFAGLADALERDLVDHS